jgi:hypothetical protein
MESNNEFVWIWNKTLVNILIRDHGICSGMIKKSV